jgi:arginase family enzyme
MLLSVDWDYFSGCVEHVFDAPIWGSRDTEFDRMEAWKHRAEKRAGDLSADFPLLENWQALKQLAGLPAYATLGHADAYGLLKALRLSSVVNLDSHHDLYSQSGDPNRVRAGNWAGLALAHGLVQHYTCIYPNWHAQVRVAEGFDLEHLGRNRGAVFKGCGAARAARH